MEPNVKPVGLAWKISALAGTLDQEVGGVALRQADIVQRHDRDGGVATSAVGVDLDQGVGAARRKAEDAVAERIAAAILGIGEDVAEVEHVAGGALGEVGDGGARLAHQMVVEGVSACTAGKPVDAASAGKRV